MRKIAEEFSRGNFGSVYDSFNDDIEWNIVGDKCVSGKLAVIDFCNKMLNEMAGSQLTNTKIIADGNSVAIEGNCSSTNADGKPATVRYCDIYAFSGDKIKAITSYCITSLANS